MNIVLEYIKYRLNAKGRHGIHSPFVFDFVDKCMQNEFSANDKKTLNSVIKSLKNNTTIIEIEDFGAGSKKLGNQRSIQKIAKTSSSQGKFGKLFYQIAKHYQPKNMLEFGTSLGIGSLHFALGNPTMHIQTIEACKNTFNIANQTFKSTHLNNIFAKNETFDHYLANNPKETFDLIFIDGHHDGNALLDYCERLKPNYHNETMLIIDDIRWSNSMFNAWQKLATSDDFHVSMDLFRMGILLPRKNQMKEHFVIKI